MKILVIGLCIVFVANLSAIVINIPEDFDSIQEGLNFASEGDTVLAAAGTYYENITWPATNGIKLVGSGEEDSIIDGNQQGSVIRFEEDLGGIIDTTTVITNFVIQNGLTNVEYPIEEGAHGGGVYCNQSSPKFDNIIITDNNTNRLGGGIHCTNNSSPVFKNMMISENSADQGGGFSCSYASPSLVDVTIDNNIAFIGAGISCFQSSPSLLNVTVTGNSTSWSVGGGIYCALSSPELDNVIVSYNNAASGGGIFFSGSSPILRDVIILNNNADNRGGGVYFSNTSPNVDTLTITSNTATYGGGMYCSNSSPILNKVTQSNNYAMWGGGIFCVANSNPNIENSISWNNSPQEVYFYQEHPNNSITISYSDIQGGEAGIETNNNGTVYWLEGNIVEEPLFVDPENGDYHLSENSPCIDAGDPNSPFDPDGTIADMGAFYFDQTVEIDNYELQISDFKLTNYPNPFNPTTTIEFSNQNDSEIDISIYNIKGQKIKSLTHNEFNKGNHSIMWNGDDESGKSVSSGVYLYKLNVNGKTEAVKKCLLLK